MEEELFITIHGSNFVNCRSECIYSVRKCTKNVRQPQVYELFLAKNKTWHCETSQQKRGEDRIPTVPDLHCPHLTREEEGTLLPWATKGDCHSPQRPSIPRAIGNGASLAFPLLEKISLQRKTKHKSHQHDVCTKLWNQSTQVSWEHCPELRCYLYRNKINPCIPLNFAFFWRTDHKNMDLSIYSKMYLSKAGMDLGIRINGQSKGSSVFKRALKWPL